MLELPITVEQAALVEAAAGKGNHQVVLGAGHGNVEQACVVGFLVGIFMLQGADAHQHHALEFEAFAAVHSKDGNGVIVRIVGLFAAAVM